MLSKVQITVANKMFYYFFLTLATAQKKRTNEMDLKQRPFAERTLEDELTLQFNSM